METANVQISLSESQCTVAWFAIKADYDRVVAALHRAGMLDLESRLQPGRVEMSRDAAGVLAIALYTYRDSATTSSVERSSADVLGRYIAASLAASSVE
jgi:hypothetical protein